MSGQLRKDLRPWKMLLGLFTAGILAFTNEIYGYRSTIMSVTQEIDKWKIRGKQSMK